MHFPAFWRNERLQTIDLFVRAFPTERRQGGAPLLFFECLSAQKMKLYDLEVEDNFFRWGTRRNCIFAIDFHCFQASSWISYQLSLSPSRRYVKYAMRSSLIHLFTLQRVNIEMPEAKANKKKWKYTDYQSLFPKKTWFDWLKIRTIFFAIQINWACHRQPVFKCFSC